MSFGLVGKKIGMTRVFTQDGVSTPVTVVEVQPNKITQVKTADLDGYTAIQVTMGSRRASRVTKPLTGHYAKANVAPGLGLWEFRFEKGEESFLGDKELKVGAELTVDLFSVDQFVDVKGISKGKGFAGVIKRYNFKSQDATHGNSLSHRAPGSIGQNQSPGKVFKGKKMAGHLGDACCTVQSQKIINVDSERNLLLIRGAIPGAPGGIVRIFPAVKKRSKGEV